MSFPNWNDAPSWANYVARDEDGRWYWYEQHPEPRFDSRNEGFWNTDVFATANDTRMARCRRAAVPAEYRKDRSWIDTLERRP